MYDTYPPVDLAVFGSIPVPTVNQVSVPPPKRYALVKAASLLAPIAVATVCPAERKVVAP